MRKVVALSIIAMIAAGVAIIFVPIVYNPAVPPICNYSCVDTGSSANYQSISTHFFGLGAIYWVVTPHFTQYCILFLGMSSCPSYGYFG
jgi:hypothetical protein